MLSAIRFLAAAASLLPLGAMAATLPFINEIHYDNAGGDIGEGVELAASAGTVLDGWIVQLYNGGTGTAYDSIALTGTVTDQGGGFGAVFVDASLQNGAPDGIALIDSEGTVHQFLSYEGAFTAISGAAAGMASTDIGVAEASDTAAGLSLQLVGVGMHYDDFTWAAPATSSYGAINTGQSFAAVPLPASLPLLGCALAGLACRRRRHPG